MATPTPILAKKYVTIDVMRIIPPVEQEIRRAIRDERARDPIIPVTKLQEKLERHFNRTFARDYLSKMNEKVARETLVEIDRAKIEERIAFTRENYRMMRDELMKIVYWKPEDNQVGLPKPLARDRVEAAKAVAMLDLALLKAEIECGIYKKPIEAIAKEFHYDPLPADVRIVVVERWRSFGLLPTAAIEKMVPLKEYANTGDNHS
jgi:hypothetical protein